MASSSIWGSILKGAGTGVTQGVSMLQQMMQQEQQQGNQDRQFNAQQDRYAQIKENMKIDNALAAAKFENTLMLQEESRQKEMIQRERDIDKENIEYEEKGYERRQGAVDLGRKREKEDLDMEVTRAQLKGLTGDTTGDKAYNDLLKATAGQSESYNLSTSDILPVVGSRKIGAGHAVARTDSLLNPQKYGIAPGVTPPDTTTTDTTTTDTLPDTPESMAQELIDAGLSADTINWQAIEKTYGKAVTDSVKAIYGKKK